VHIGLVARATTRMKLKNFCVSGGLIAMPAHWSGRRRRRAHRVRPGKLRVPRTGSVEQSLKLRLQPGYHVNSDKPNDDFLIPLRLSWEKGAWRRWRWSSRSR